MPETTCVVPFSSRRGRHIFPRDEKRRKAWVHAIKRGKTKYEKWSPTKYSYLCENHFTDDDYYKDTYSGVERQKRALKKTAIPSVFAWTCRETVAKNKASQERNLNRSVLKRKLFSDSSEEQISHPEVFAQPLHQVCNELGIGASEEIVSVEEDVLREELQAESIKSSSNAEVQTIKLPAFSIQNFEKDDRAVHFYTGLENYKKFFFVLRTLGPAVYHLNYIHFSVVSVSIPDQFFIVLMKLRRHTTSFEVSRMFGITESVITNIFITWILFMEKQWRSIDIWPSKDLVQYFRPSSFRRKFLGTRVILDATESSIKKPKNPTSQQASFSSYKNRNTVKVLVGISPGGLVFYVSPSYGGSTSDRQIVERSGLPNLSTKHDSIMADKGFNVQDLFAPNDVHVNIPTFFRKKE